MVSPSSRLLVALYFGRHALGNMHDTQSGLSELNCERGGEIFTTIAIKPSTWTRCILRKEECNYSLYASLNQTLGKRKQELEARIHEKTNQDL